MVHGGSPRGANEKRGERDDGRLGRERQSWEATTGVTSRRGEIWRRLTTRKQK